MAKIDTSSSTKTYAYSSNGLSGLASGLDTESMVQAMLLGTQNKIDAQNQKIQQLEWKQSQYRDITTSILSFQDKFLSFSGGSKTNLRSASFFNQLSLNSTNSKIKVTNTSTNANTSFNITNAKMASATKLTGASGVKGNVEFNDLDDGAVSTLKGKTFTITLDGISKDVTISDSDKIQTMSDIVNDINSQLKNKFGSAIKMDYDSNDKKLVLKASTKGSKVTFTCNDDETKTVLGMTENTISNRMQNGLTIKDIFGVSLKPTDIPVMEKNENGELVQKVDADKNPVMEKGYTFTINGKEFKVSENTSINALMKEINGSDAGVVMSYDSINDRFMMQAANTGKGIDIEMQDTNNCKLLQKLFVDSTDKTDVDTSTFTIKYGTAGIDYSKGENATLMVDGVEIERTSNSFEVNGVLVTILENMDSSESSTVTANQDTESIVSGIKEFVNGYNELIKSITEKTKEKAEYRSYPALTDAQKEEMSEKEIEKWEKKSQTGLLRSDSILTSFLSQMRSQLYVRANEGGLALYDLGITTNTDGTLKIDEGQLNKAVETNLEGVKTLFTDTEKGLATRINNVVDTFAKTSAANPGLLVTKAGYKDTTSDTQNSITKEIASLKNFLETLKDRYDSEKQRYWNQFTTLEKLISNGNSMVDYFSSM